MKKIVVLILILFLGKVSLSADLEQVAPTEQQNVLNANIEFNWVDMSQNERDTIISQHQSELFGEDIIYKYSKKDFKEEYKDFLKDFDYKRHYMLVSNNVRETNDENICGFYKGKLLVSYAIQYKNNLSTVYYYDVLGNLRYVDKFSSNYPNFPYTSKQYRSTGKLISAIYVASHDLQYLFREDKTFRGIWYKDKMYNSKAKEILSRTNW